MNFGNLNLTRIFLFPFGTALLVIGLDQFFKIEFLFSVTVECIGCLVQKFHFKHNLNMNII